jgi:hypothetical protein
MNRLYEIFKTPSGSSTGKALLNHTIFSPSQTGDTVPLISDPGGSGSGSTTLVEARGILRRTGRDRREELKLIRDRK